MPVIDEASVVNSCFLLYQDLCIKTTLFHSENKCLQRKIQYKHFRSLFLNK